MGHNRLHSDRKVYGEDDGDCEMVYPLPLTFYVVRGGYLIDACGKVGRALSHKVIELLDDGLWLSGEVEHLLKRHVGRSGLGVPITAPSVNFFRHNFSPSLRQPPLAFLWGLYPSTFPP